MAMASRDIYQLIHLAQAGDKEARDELVSINIGLIWSVVKRFNNRGHELEDLFQIGSIGLLKAIDKFDFSYNVKFSTYAVPMILGEIRRYIRDHNPIKVARSLTELASKIHAAREKMAKTLNREPTVNELAEELKVDPSELILALDASKPVVSLHDVAYQEDGSAIYVIDQIDGQADHQEDWIDNLALKEALAKLDSQERQIIVLRYFKHKTQTEVAKMLKMTQVQVSRSERKILHKIRELIS